MGIRTNIYLVEKQEIDKCNEMSIDEIKEYLHDDDFEFAHIDKLKTLKHIEHCGKNFLCFNREQQFRPDVFDEFTPNYGGKEQMKQYILALEADLKRIEIEEAKKWGKRYDTLDEIIKDGYNPEQEIKEKRWPKFKVLHDIKKFICFNLNPAEKEEYEEKQNRFFDVLAGISEYICFNTRAVRARSLKDRDEEYLATKYNPRFNSRLIDLEDDSILINNSETYEHILLNMCFIYKTTDWDKYYFIEITG